MLVAATARRVCLETTPNLTQGEEAHAIGRLSNSRSNDHPGNSWKEVTHLLLQSLNNNKILIKKVV